MAVRDSSAHLPRWSVQDWSFKASTEPESELEEDGIANRIHEIRNGKDVWVGNKIGAWKYYYNDYYDIPEKTRDEEGFDEKLEFMRSQLQRYHISMNRREIKQKQEEKEKQEERIKKWIHTDTLRINKMAKERNRKRRIRRHEEPNYNSESSNDGSYNDSKNGPKKKPRLDWDALRRQWNNADNNNADNNNTDDEDWDD